jgi:Tol biopolymer transport system component
MKPVFVAPNHLVFAQYSGIFILRLNDSQVLKIAGLTDQLRTRQGDFGIQIAGNSESLTGEEIKAMSTPIPLAKPVCFENLIFSLSASRDGPVAYRENSNMVRQMTWRDRRGKEIGSLPDLPESSTQCRMRISPDNRTVAFCNGSGIFLFDVMKSAVRKAADEFLPVWSPNGDSIALSRFSYPNGFVLYRQPIDGGAAALLLNNNEGDFPEDWSRDGNFLLFMNILSGYASSYDLLALPLKGDNRNPIPIARSSAQEKNGRFSPNGQWIAYQSDELGKRNEVFLQPFPEQTSERRRASIDGGSSPEWGPEGKELYFLSPDNHLRAATVTYSENGRSVEVGKPAPLFSLPLGADYTVSADGQRFLIIEPVGDPPPIIVLPNWQYKK